MKGSLNPARVRRHSEAQRLYRRGEESLGGTDRVQADPRAVWLRAANSLRLALEDRAAQVAEFAVSLPLLILFVVGIYDFSGAVALKQKLTNAAREAARVAAADPSNDVSAPSLAMPVSIKDAEQVVDNYLLSEQLNDCGLSTSSPDLSSSAITCRRAQMPRLLPIARPVPGEESIGPSSPPVSPFNIRTSGNSAAFQDFLPAVF
jgi:hypothetical protein